MNQSIDPVAAAEAARDAARERSQELRDLSDRAGVVVAFRAKLIASCAVAGILPTDSEARAYRRIIAVDDRVRAATRTAYDEFSAAIDAVRAARDAARGVA